MKLKKSTMAIIGLLVLGVVAVVAVAMGDGKTARKAVRIVGGNGHGYAPGPSIVAAEEAKKDQDPFQPGLLKERYKGIPGLDGDLGDYRDTGLKKRHRGIPGLDGDLDDF